ncbi:MAG: antitoxin, partial [Gammaproteobacteria bacterium]
SVRSGKSVSSDKVEAWLSTWGSPNERKAPEK